MYNFLRLEIFHFCQISTSGPTVPRSAVVFLHSQSITGQRKLTYSFWIIEEITSKYRCLSELSLWIKWLRISFWIDKLVIIISEGNLVFDRLSQMNILWRNWQSQTLTMMNDREGPIFQTDCMFRKTYLKDKEKSVFELSLSRIR